MNKAHHMHPEPVRRAAAELLQAGEPVPAVARQLGVSRRTVHDWSIEPASMAVKSTVACVRCTGLSPAPAASYAALLGYYLGDGAISTYRGKGVLRVSCDRTYPRIIADVGTLIDVVHPGRVFHAPAPGVVVVQSNWKHWPCLFPQHGPERKHDRTLVLESWQLEIVQAFPSALLRGLFHSDGCRAKNWTRRPVAGQMKRYDYPRWQFTNNSADIQRFCCEALDRVGLPWRQSYWKTISVSTRAGVARLDELIGPKG